MGPRGVSKFGTVHTVILLQMLGATGVLLVNSVRYLHPGTALDMAVVLVLSQRCGTLPRHLVPLPTPKNKIPPKHPSEGRAHVNLTEASRASCAYEARI